MLCKACNKNRATFTKFVPSLGGVVPLCPTCLSKGAYIPPMFNATITTYSNINGMESIKQVSYPAGLLARSAPIQLSQVVCPNCGYDLNDFKRTSRLGCSNCYSVFERQLAPMIQSIHGVQL